MYVGENESAKFWLSIMNGLKNRGVEDILIACVDGLNGIFHRQLKLFIQKQKSSSALFIKSVIQRSLFPTKTSKS
mgnify:CR=1 FL=1